MWHPLPQPDAPGDVRRRIVIVPHHPDRLRRPSDSLAVHERDRFHQTLLWNVFRTLELLPPSFWLRRLHARLMDEVLTPAPQVAWIRLWSPLTLPPIQRVDGAQADAVADVLIETEHAVWTLMCPTARDPWDAEGRFARVVDGGAWLAGARAHYGGIIEQGGDRPRAGDLFRQRYLRSRESVSLRSSTRGPGAPAPASIGSVGWPDLVAILRECADAGHLSSVERAVALNASSWLAQAGIGADAGPRSLLRASS